MIYTSCRYVVCILKSPQSDIYETWPGADAYAYRLTLGKLLLGKARTIRSNFTDGSFILVLNRRFGSDDFATAVVYAAQIDQGLGNRGFVFG